jgi:anti-anti-sigma factor
MLAVAPGCQFEVDRGPDWLLVKLRKVEADGPGSQQLAEQMWRLLQQHFTYRLVLELDQIAVLNSTLIAQLIQLYQRIREHDGVLRLCGLSPYNRRVLHNCALDDRFPSYDSREEAVMGGCGPRHAR